MPELNNYSPEEKVQMEAWLVSVLQKCKNAQLQISEKRNYTFERVELVVYRNDIDEWKRIFAEDYGGIRKDEGATPTEEDMAITKSYGGVNEMQTLFVKELESFTAIAMFWPWGDDLSMTVHMGFVFQRKLDDLGI